MKNNCLTNLILIITLLFSSIMAQPVKINEIFFSNMNEQTTEFIELYNQSGEVISILGYTMGINNNVDTLISETNQYILAPGEFVIVTNLNSGETASFSGRFRIFTLMTEKFNFFRNVANKVVLYNEYKEVVDSASIVLTPRPDYSVEYNSLLKLWDNARVKHGTPGEENSLLLESVDLEIKNFTVAAIDEKFKPEISLSISNNGLKPVSDAELKIGNDENQNGKIDKNELLKSDKINIISRETINYNTGLEFSAAGVFSLLAEITSPDDQLMGNNRKTAYHAIAFEKSSLLINEFMYNPNSGQPEWVEVFNNTENEINLKYWQIGDAGSRKQITARDYFLQPAEYLVVAEDSLFFDNWEEEKNFLLAENGLPSLNNSGDSILILDPGSNRIDSLDYQTSWGSERGVSLEKIDPAAVSNDAGNWGLSVHEKGGTPGFVNSIILKDFDLAIDPDSTGLLANKIFPGDTVDFLVNIKNFGREPSKAFKLNVYFSSADTIFDTVMVSRDFGPLPKNQSLIDTINLGFANSGIHYIKAEVEFPEDENPENNSLIVPAMVGFFQKSMVINEIMYNPETGKPEWFEIANISGSTINVRNWLFRDSQNTIHIATEQALEIPPDSFAVITQSANFTDYYEHFSGILLQSASFPTLNNSGDSLILLDPVGNYIDSLGFASEWGAEQGVSLERKSTEQESSSFINWGLCQNEFGSTPGYTNSNALKDFDLAIDTIYIKDERVLDGEDAIVVLRILNNGAKTIHNFDLSINVWDDINKEVVISEKYINVNKTISAGYFTRYELELPGMPGGVHPLVAKIYALKDNIIDNNEFRMDLKIGYASNAIIVNEIMYSPHPGEAEWIELFNTGSQKINLHHWLFKDLSNKYLPFCDTVRYIGPEEYVVMASNEEIFETFPDIHKPVLIPEKFPTLNNTSDAVVVFDAVSHCVDSVYYMKSWGGDAGVSIERRNPFVPAVARDNWGSSLDSLGGTPGFRNTILKYDYDLAAVEKGFIFETPQTKPFTENQFSIAVKNNGIYASGPFSIQIFHDKNYDDYGEEEELVWGLNNIPSLEPDSIAVVKGKLYSENSGRSHYIAKIVTNSEENIADNEITTVLEIEFDENALVLNEFLAAPESGETEFLECINNTEFDVRLQGWELYNQRRSAIIDFDTKIPAGQYVVFCEDSSFFDLYPLANAPVFVLKEWPGMNNSADQIVLKDLTGKLIDSLQYTESWPVENGKSLEKIMPAWPSEDSASWKLCEAETGGTPGKFNSISPYVYDLQINDMWISGTKGDFETLFDIKFYIENIGREKCDEAELKIYDVKFNSKSLYRSIRIKAMEPGTSDSISMQIANLDKGYHNFLAQIIWQRDQNADNDTTNFPIDISYELNDVYITEFMAAPKTVQSRGVSIAEYIEIYNPQNRSVHIDNWKITDENTAAVYDIISEKNIPAESYFVIATDSTIFNFPDANNNNTVVLEKMPSLNNDSDKILIIDPTGVVVDSVVYTTEWKIEQGTAKEKIYMENENFLNNWRSATSPQGGTPGAENSVVVVKTEKKAGLRTEPNPFTPNGDGLEDEVGFFYQLSYPSANIRIDIYDLTGRLIASPVENMRTSSKGVVYWDGTNKYGEMARVGMYIARITATDANSRKSEGHIATFTLMK